MIPSLADILTTDRGSLPYQICSSFVAWCYDVETGVRFNHVDWPAVELDDIDDKSLRPDTDFETVLEWRIN